MAFCEVKSEYFKEVSRKNFFARFYVVTSYISFHVWCMFKPFEIRHADGTLLAKLHFNGLLEVFPGYFWDGPSGPTIDTIAFVFASLPHDIGYQALRENLNHKPEVYFHCMSTLLEDFKKTRGQFDNTMNDINKRFGMCRARRFYTYKLVRKYGQKHALPQELKDYLKVS